MEIFISYRRADSGYVADRLYEKMLQKVSKERIFIDRESIPKGKNFDRHIRHSVECAKVIIPIIGARWVGELEDRTNAAHEESTQDYVRLELALALRLSKPIIPVLIDHTMMPSEAELPEDLKQLAYKNAATLRRQPDFDNDFAILLKEILNIVGSKKTTLKEPMSFGDLGI